MWATKINYYLFLCSTHLKANMVMIVRIKLTIEIIIPMKETNVKVSSNAWLRPSSQSSCLKQISWTWRFFPWRDKKYLLILHKGIIKNHTTRTAKLVRWLQLQVTIPSSLMLVVQPSAVQSFNKKLQETHISEPSAVNYDEFIFKLAYNDICVDMP